MKSFDTLLEKVSGSTYKLYSSEVGLGTNSATTPANDPQQPNHLFHTNGRLAHWLFADSATMTLNSNGTLSYDADSGESEVYVDTFATHDVDSPSIPDIKRVEFSNPVNETGVGTEAGTWCR